MNKFTDETTNELRTQINVASDETAEPTREPMGTDLIASLISPSTHVSVFKLKAFPSVPSEEAHQFQKSGSAELSGDGNAFIHAAYGEESNQVREESSCVTSSDSLLSNSLPIGSLLIDSNCTSEDQVLYDFPVQEDLAASVLPRQLRSSEMPLPNECTYAMIQIWQNPPAKGKSEWRVSLNVHTTPIDEITNYTKTKRFFLNLTTKGEFRKRLTKATKSGKMQKKVKAFDNSLEWDDFRSCLITMSDDPDILGTDDLISMIGSGTFKNYNVDILQFGVLKNRKGPNPTLIIYCGYGEKYVCNDWTTGNAITAYGNARSDKASKYIAYHDPEMRYAKFLATKSCEEKKVIWSSTNMPNRATQVPSNELSDLNAKVDTMYRYLERLVDENATLRMNSEYLMRSNEELQAQLDRMQQSTQDQLKSFRDEVSDLVSAVGVELKPMVKTLTRSSLQDAMERTRIRNESKGLI